MINRVLIRLKIVQIVYAYYQNGGKNLDTAEKELFFSLSKAYDLYNYLLLLMVEVTKQANKRLNAAKNKLVPTKEELFPNTKFVENRFIAQLEVNKQLLEFSNNQKKTWENEADFVKTLCDKILESDIYKEYMASETSSYEEDRELWRKLYKNIIFNNIELDQVLEDQSLYDLNRPNRWYWYRLREFAKKAEKYNVYLYHNHYFQHNILEAGAHWVDSPWRTTNNINQTDFPEPVPFAGDKSVNTNRFTRTCRTGNQHMWHLCNVRNNCFSTDIFTGSK